ncbi:hypothetical protein HELRODRAFT_170072 [Helobdella robusta]|uniref:Uncharacterized protein n=1 Tax=Helobdella robusta TaxID=6412 RepID=T1F2L7_HELRO|nr:hypothetical protein HELRODRAFT_170072 [Helobdella robusta]ESO07530.1 hypothetical protein HELRODRAFT_170072 [Helobdella robusta]
MSNNYQLHFNQKSKAPKLSTRQFVINKYLTVTSSVDCIEEFLQVHLGSRPPANPVVHPFEAGKWVDDVSCRMLAGEVAQMRAESNISMAIIYSAYMIRWLRVHINTCVRRVKRINSPCGEDGCFKSMVEEMKNIKDIQILYLQHFSLPNKFKTRNLMFWQQMKTDISLLTIFACIDLHHNGYKCFDVARKLVNGSGVHSGPHGGVVLNLKNYLRTSQRDLNFHPKIFEYLCVCI